MEAEGVAVVVTAGGRLPASFGAKAGEVKALLPLGGTPLITRVLETLASVPGTGEPVVVGPFDDLRTTVANRTNRLVAEGETAPENIRRALQTLSPEEKGRPVLLSTSDLPFMTPEAVNWLLEHAPTDAEIVFPVITRAAFEAAFPGSPNIYARLAGEEYTGGSILVIRANAIERNLGLIEKVFAARKSQFQMARLLGLPCLLRFLTGTLTVTQAEQRASLLTGCRCRALLGAPPEISADIDNPGDYAWAEAFLTSRRPDASGTTVTVS